MARVVVTTRNAIKFVDQHGALLVFPMKGREDVPSLWKCFFPRKRMDWDWSSSGDEAVPLIWHLRAALSESGEIVYTKWFQNRATVISKDLFPALLARFSKNDAIANELPDNARHIYSLLLEDSPLGTKEIKRRLFDEFGVYEVHFDTEMRALWKRQLIVGYGEVDEGGFPSLAVGATRLLFEDLWDESLTLTHEDCLAQFQRYFGADHAFYKPSIRALKR